MRDTKEKRSKRQIREIYRCEKSMNRITDRDIQTAIDHIGLLQAQGKDVKMNQKNIVDFAYDMQY